MATLRTLDSSPGFAGRFEVNIRGTFENANRLARKKCSRHRVESVRSGCSYYRLSGPIQPARDPGICPDSATVVVGQFVVVFGCIHDPGKAELLAIADALDARASVLARLKAGKSMLANIAMMAMTTSNSIKVKTRLRARIFISTILSDPSPPSSDCFR